MCPDDGAPPLASDVDRVAAPASGMRGVVEAFVFVVLALALATVWLDPEARTSPLHPDLEMRPDAP